ASFNYYRDDIDGIVGPNLMRAVVKFQKEMGLKISGYPDVRTIFLLNSFKEFAQYGGQKARQKAAG
ncbi:MAG TPA: peptidoglycan-binding protein, partial [Desulfobacterales bacterium]|nr:peptidoglycan-binding protein [Desulfobacterales bacterium]